MGGDIPSRQLGEEGRGSLNFAQVPELSKSVSASITTPTGDEVSLGPQPFPEATRSSATTTKHSRQTSAPVPCPYVDGSGHTCGQIFPRPRELKYITTCLPGQADG